MKTSAGNNWDLIFMPSIIMITYCVIGGFIVEQVLKWIN